MLLKEVCKISANNYQEKDNWFYFNYLDTGSLTKNNIDSFQKFNSTKELPSRAKQKVKKDTILYSSVRPNQEHYGYIDKYYDNLLVSTGFIILEPTQSKVNPKYLYYYITQKRITDLLQGIAQNSTSSYPSITKDDLLDLEIDLPPRPMQDKIAEIFSNIDNQIERNNDMVKTLQVLAQTTYCRWFNQFEFPDEHGLPYQSNGGELIYNEELKREIPVGWEVEKIKNVLKSLNTGLNPRNNFVLNNGDIKYITVKNLTSTGELDLSTLDTINRDSKQIINRRSKIEIGDILYASISPLGRCHLIYENPNWYDINESVFSFKPNEKITSEYLFFILNDSNFTKKAEKSAMGSVFKGIRNSTIMDTLIMLPPKDTLNNFSTITYAILRQKNKIEMKNIELNNLKSKLLPLLINGQLDI